MRIFLRLFSYVWVYRRNFIFGVFISFLVAFFNGLSLTAFIPLFESLREDSDVYLTQFSRRERSVLTKIIHLSPEHSTLSVQSLPEAPQKIDQDLSHILITHLQKYPSVVQKLSILERLEAQTVFYFKLKINTLALSPFHVVTAAALVALPLYGLKLFLFLLCVRLIARVGYRAVRNIRNELYAKIQRLPLTWYYRNKSGELVSRIGNDIEMIASVISNNMRDAITNFFYILVNVVLLAYLNLELFLISIIATPVILLPVTLLTRKLRTSANRSQNLLAELHGHLQETISGMKVIRLTGMEDYETKRFGHVNDRLYWRRFKEIYYTHLGPYLVELNSVIVTLGILSLGVTFLDATDFTYGEFLAFILILLVIVRPIIQLSGMYAKVQGAVIAGKRVFELIDKEYEVKDPIHPLPLQPLKHSICFENVCFTYPETQQEVLHNISFEVPAGSTVALVGQSGGGKSTLLDLLVRFFIPSSGRILFDGQDIQNFRIVDHRSRLGIVTQNIFLFHGTISNNIAYGKRDAENVEVQKAARLAYAHDFIRNFDNGYQTVVGNYGLSLSGGQRQRIAIARALLRDPEILVLDEATSSLDTNSEQIVQRAFERLFRNRTTFVIAHRLSTIQKADIILVVSQGRIVEQGSHESLLKKGGHYAHLQQV